MRAKIATPAEIYLAGQSLSRIKITIAIMKQLRLARIPSAIATLPRRLKFPFISCVVNLRIQEGAQRWSSGGAGGGTQAAPDKAG